MTFSSPAPEGIELYARPSGDRMRVLRLDPPAEVRVQWLTDGPGRVVQNRMLSGLSVLEVGNMAAAIAHNEDFVLGALRELGQRPEWRLQRVGPSYFRLTGGDSDENQEVSRLDLLLALELLIRASMAPLAGKAADLPWQERAMAAHAEVLDALGDEPLFQEVPTQDS